MSVFVCASVTFVRTGRTLAKIKNVKKTFVDFVICHRIAKIILRDRDLLFEDNKLFLLNI